MTPAPGERRTRVVIVSRVKRNPYVQLLAEGLRQPELGLDVRLEDNLSVGWVWAQRCAIDVLHLHWLELFFTFPSLGRSLKRWISVMLGLWLARKSGVRLVYTLHNLEQHEGRRPRLTRWGLRLMLRLADAIHVHDAETAAVLAREWRRARGVHVIAHGNYVGAYPNTLTRAQARAQLGLSDDAFVYLSLGRVRPYKGLDELIAAFGRLPVADATLLIAGEVQDPGYERVLQQLAAADRRVQLALAFVPEKALQVYLNACDVAVLPYRHVTTSGAAHLAFSFEVPIVAPRLGCFVELVGPRSERGLLYDDDTGADLTEALARVRDADLAAMRQACAAYAQAHDWQVIARQHAAMYARSWRGA
jgi:glycosyltransferase involved in cell wall biosynthesis